MGVGWSPGACGDCGHCRRNEAFACENVHGATAVSRDGAATSLVLVVVGQAGRRPSWITSAYWASIRLAVRRSLSWARLIRI